MEESKSKWTEGKHNKETQHSLYIQRKEVKKSTRNIGFTASDDKT